MGKFSTRHFAGLNPLFTTPLACLIADASEPPRRNTLLAISAQARWAFGLLAC